MGLRSRSVPYGNFSRAATQSLTATVPTAIVMDTTSQDKYGMLGSPASRLVVPNGWTGQYLAFGQIAFAANSDITKRFASFRINGVATDYWLQALAAINSASFATWSVFSGGLYLNAGDYVEIFGRQDSAGALNVVAARFSLNWLAPA